MANEITVSVADAGLPEIWMSEALLGLYDRRLVSVEPVIWVKEVTGKNKGDNIDFTEFADTSTNAVGSDGSVTNQSITHTQRQVALSSWREATWDVVDRASLQSVFDYSVLAPREQAAAIGEYMDDTVLDDHGSFNGSNAIGDTANPAPLNIDFCLDADAVLYQVPLPDKEPRHFVLYPRSYAQLFKGELVASASHSGGDKGAQVSGTIKTILGWPVIRTSRVVTTGTPYVAKNLLLGRHAIAMGISRDIKLDVFRVDKANQYSTDVLFGEAVIRSNFAVTMNNKSAA